MLAKYKKTAKQIAAMVSKKQIAYGDAFGRSGEIIKILYPDGIRPDQYHDALAVIRMIDKLFRIANQKDAFGEDPWKDIAGYALLAASKNIGNK